MDPYWFMAGLLEKLTKEEKSCCTEKVFTPTHTSTCTKNLKRPRCFPYKSGRIRCQTAKFLWVKVYSTKHIKSFERSSALISAITTISFWNDTLVLARLVEDFRRVCHNSDGLDSAHYLTCSHPCGDAFLKICQPNLELRAERERVRERESEQLKIVENRIRCGLFSLFEMRKAVVSNEEVSGYDSSQQKTSCLLLDAKNLYGVTREKFPLPRNRFQLVTIGLQRILETSDDALIVFFLEVDLACPNVLHDSHQHLPLAPTKEEIDYQELGNWQQCLLQRVKMSSRRSPTIKRVNSVPEEHYTSLQNFKAICCSGFRSWKCS